VKNCEGMLPAMRACVTNFRPILRTMLSGCALLLCVAIMAASDSSNAQTKRATLKLTCRASEQGASPVAEGPITVSNLKRIRLEIYLSGSRLPPGGISLTAAHTKNLERSQFGVEIAVDMITNGKRVPVQVNAATKGFGIRPGEQYITVLMDIPDEAKRKHDIDEYLKRLEAAAIKEGRAAEFDRQVKQQRAAMVATLERLYVDNRIGEFEITCRHSARQSDVWPNAVSSEPIRMRVKFDGDFFDLPNFKD
jgi:hypothetical protein